MFFSTCMFFTGTCVFFLRFTGGYSDLCLCSVVIVVVVNGCVIIMVVIDSLCEWYLWWRYQLMCRYYPLCFWCPWCQYCCGRCLWRRCWLVCWRYPLYCWFRGVSIVVVVGIRNLWMSVCIRPVFVGLERVLVLVRLLPYAVFDLDLFLSVFLTFLLYVWSLIVQVSPVLICSRQEFFTHHA